MRQTHLRSNVPVEVRPLGGRQAYMCQDDGKIEPATTVDHRIPHKGDQKLFWDKANWQPLCTTHHNASKQRAEARGVVPGHDATGQPTDPTHPWARQKAALRRQP